MDETAARLGGHVEPEYNDRGARPIVTMAGAREPDEVIYVDARFFRWLAARPVLARPADKFLALDPLKLSKKVGS